MVSSSISVGDRDLIDSGSVLAYGDESIEITLEPDDSEDITHAQEMSIDQGLTFEFDFVEDPEEDPDIDLTVISDNKAKITVLNQRKGGVVFGGATPPIGTNTPVNIGTFGGRELYLGYLVTSRIDQESEPEVSQLTYNFYLGGEIDVSE